MEPFAHLLFFNMQPTQILLGLTQPFKQSIYWGSPFIVWMLKLLVCLQNF